MQIKIKNCIMIHVHIGMNSLLQKFYYELQWIIW